MLKSYIPYVDLRGKTPTDLLRMYPDQAASLLRSTRRTLGLASYAASAALLPVSDRASRRWLKKTANPYLHEIEAAAEFLGKKGVYTFNLAYEWGCTSGAYATGEGVAMLRVLDWPFPALGKHVVIALQQGQAGEYYNVTWPALSGIYQGMAPGRFAAAINQAPMRMHKAGFMGDWAINRIIAGRTGGLPPSHALRHVFDHARTYDEAKEMLCRLPLSMPVIYTLTGTSHSEGCVIERLEDRAELQEVAITQYATCSNQFHSSFAALGKGWRPRATESEARYRQSLQITPYDLSQNHFDWLRMPVLNGLTRLAMQADARTGALCVQGYEGQVAVTHVFAILPPDKDV